jgi:hypothetical protein
VAAQRQMTYSLNRAKSRRCAFHSSGISFVRMCLMLALDTTVLDHSVTEGELKEIYYEENPPAI